MTVVVIVLSFFFNIIFLNVSFDLTCLMNSKVILECFFGDYVRVFTGYQRVR